MALSCSDDYLLMGNFMADMITNKDVALLPAHIKKGIDLHRLIDSFTDSHPSVSKVNALLHKNHHKYAPVISDVLFDYVLAYNWQKFGHGDLKSFTGNIYNIVESNLDVIPERKHKMVRSMIGDDFLMKYTTYDGLEFVFKKMSNRLRYESNFHLAVEDLKTHFDKINEHFKVFFPDIMNEVQLFCGC